MQERTESQSDYTKVSEAPLSTTERNLPFEEYIKNHLTELRDNSELSGRVIADAAICLHEINQKRAVSPSLPATYRVYDIYIGLLTLGTADAQVISLTGLQDSDDFVRTNIKRKLKSSPIHEEVFSTLANTEEGTKIAIELIQDHTLGTGFDENGRVFPSVEAIIQDAFKQNHGDDEEIKLALIATKLQGQAVSSVEESRRTGQEGLSEETRNIVADIFAKRIQNITEPLIADPEKMKQACADIVSGNFEKIKKAIASAEENKCNAAKKEVKTNSEASLINIEFSMELPKNLNADEYVKALTALFPNQDRSTRIAETTDTYDHLLRGLRHSAFEIIRDRIKEEAKVAKQKKEKEQAEQETKDQEAKTKAEKAKQDAAVEIAANQDKLSHSLNWLQEHGITLN